MFYKFIINLDTTINTNTNVITDINIEKNSNETIFIEYLEKLKLTYVSNLLEKNINENLNQTILKHKINLTTPT